MQPLRIVSSRASAVPVADLLKALDAQPEGEVLAKATVKKQIWVQSYTRSDGTVVPTHQAWVHVSDDHDDAKLLAGQGSWSQKQAHAQLAGQPWFQALPADHKAPVLLHHATSIQEKASSDAAVSMFKQSIIAGKVPTPAQAKAFNAQPYEKQLEIAKQLLAKQPKTPELLAAAGKHLPAVEAPAPPVAPAAPAVPPPKVVAAAEKPAAVPPPPAESPDGSPITFHHTTDGHNKFWTVAVSGSKLTTHFGAIGTKGAIKEKVLHSPAAAKAARAKLIGEKLLKGYKHAPTQAMPAAHAAPAAPEVAKPAAVLPAGLHLGSIDEWPQTGSQKGSNPGGRFKAPDGSEWYCKFPASEDHVKNEVLAAKLYEAAGVKVPELRTVSKGGKLGVASRWVDGVSKGSPAELSAAAGAFEGFAVDAWVGNWDAVGMATDNLLIEKGGAAVRIDVGGALLFRAQGAPKGAAFGTEVGEIDSLRGKSLDPAKNNAQAAAVFGKMTNLQVAQSAARVLAISQEEIESACSTFGPGSVADRAALAKKLLMRRAYMATWINKHAGEIVPAKPAKAKKVVVAGESGPKDGDTKQGAKGTLVFKDGRWHAQAKAAMPTPPSMTGSTMAAATLARLQQAAEAGDAAKFDELHGKVSAKAASSSLLKWKNLKVWADKVKAQYFSAAEAPRSVAAGKKVAAAAEKPAVAPDAHAGLHAAITSAFLPTSNSNHVPANKKLAAIQAALAAGDLPALQAMTFGSNTYGKKAAKLAEQAAAALGGAVAAAPAPAAPAAPAKVVAAVQKPVPAKKKRLDATKLPVKASDLPPVHDFMNWKGPGSGLSSSAAVNAQNLADEQALLAFAAKGNLVELKAYKYQAIDKGTGAKVGLKPIESHPSTHVKAYHSDLVAFLEAIAHPPKPLEVVDTKAASVPELAKNAGWEKLGVTSSTAKGEKRLGFFIGLSKATNPKKFAPATTSHVSAAAKVAAAAKHKSLPKLARHFISSVQSSGTYNNYFRDGKTHDANGNKTAEVAAVCYDAASEMPEGTTIYRWMNMPDTMVKQLMAADDGLIFQNPGSMCCSMSPTATQGFGQHRMVIRYAKGAKAMNSFASGSFASEQEITALMGQRFMILKKEMVEGKGGGSSKRLELEVLMLPPDPGYVADLKAQAASTMTKSLRVVSARALG